MLAIEDALARHLGGLPLDDDHPRAEQYVEWQQEAYDLAKALRRQLGEIAGHQHTELTALRTEREAPPLPHKAAPLPTY